MNGVLSFFLIIILLSFIFKKNSFAPSVLFDSYSNLLKKESTAVTAEIINKYTTNTSINFGNILKAFLIPNFS